MTKTEQFLIDTYGAPVLKSREVAECLGFNSTNAFLNAVSANQVALRTFRRGRGRYALVSDVAAYLDHLREEAA